MFTACGLSDDAARASGRRSRRCRSRRRALARRDAGRHVYRANSPRLGVDRGARSTIVSDRDGAVVLDAGHALGHLTGRAGDGARGRARANGSASPSSPCATASISGPRVATRWRLRDAGCIGIAMCNTRPLMPAPGGAERLVGNNPIAIALPSRRGHSDRARHGDQRGGHGQDPDGGEGKGADPGQLGGHVRWRADHECGARRSPACCCRRAGRKASVSHSSSISCAGCFPAARPASRCGRSTATFRCRTIARISSLRSMSRISAISTAFAGRRPPPPNGSGRADARRASTRCLPRASRNGGRRERAAGVVELGPAVAAMLVRFARELGVSAHPLDLHSASTAEEAGHAQA